MGVTNYLKHLYHVTSYKF